MAKRYNKVKYGLIVLLLVGIALAGCKKQDTTADNVAQNNENLIDRKSVV